MRTSRSCLLLTKVLSMALPMFLTQFLDTDCLLCGDTVDTFAEPTTLVLSDSEMVHGSVCQRCIALHADHVPDMHVHTLQASVHAFEQWQRTTDSELVAS